MIKDLRRIAVIAAAFMIAALTGYVQMAAGDQIAGEGLQASLSPWAVFAAESDEGQSDNAADENDDTADESDDADGDSSESGSAADSENKVSVKVSVGEHGTVNGHSSDYTETLASGQTLSLAIQAAAGYAISDILVNGVSLHAADQENVVGQSSATEELEDLEEDLSIAVKFAAAEPDGNTGEESSDDEAGSDDIGGDDEDETGGDADDEDNDSEDVGDDETGGEGDADILDDWDEEDWVGEDEDEWNDEDIDESDEDWDYEDEENLDGETTAGEDGESY